MPSCMMEEQLRQIVGEDLHNALINTLTERMRGLESVKLSQDQRKGRVGGCTGAAGRGGRDVDGSREETVVMEPDCSERGRHDGEKVWMRKVLGSMKKLTLHYLDRVTAWREVVKKWECSSPDSPHEGSKGRHARAEDPTDSSLSTIFETVSEDINVILDKLNTILTRLDEEMLLLCSQPTEVSPPPQNPTGQSQTPSPPDDPRSISGDPSTCDAAEEETESERPDVNTTTGTDETLDPGQQEEDKDHLADSDRTSLETDGGAADKDKNKKDGVELKWITAGLSGHLGSSFIPDMCYIRAPAGVAQVLHCEVVDALSCFIVTGSEELVSRVIRLRVQDGVRVSFPIVVVIPFYTRYRGNYRDMAVKVVDVERRSSYICPVTTEGNYGGQRGSFAEVRVYSLGLFAVVSCLKRENYTVPRKGLSLKLSMDPRICLTYLPGSFTAPVMAQAMIQPLDAVLLSAVKSRSEENRAVVSTSPVLYLTHPTCQPLRRALTVTLPCAPKPKQKTRALDETPQSYSRHMTTASNWGSSSRIRMLPDCAKSTQELHSEFLVLLGFRDQQWSSLEKITVRNQQKGLVSFELTENFDRLLVVRLLSTLSPCHLVSLVENLEEAVNCHTVAIVILRQTEDPHTMMVAVVLSKDLTWELSKLKAQGFTSTTDSSLEISMCEGDRLLLRFSGNITSEGALNSQNEHKPEWIAFHSQRTNHLRVRLCVVDPFGNHSSAHYKGTAMFHKVSRGQMDGSCDWSCDCPGAVNMKLLGEPICKLPLTLPKKEKNISQPNVTQVKICEDTTHSLSDSLLLWISEQLSAEELSRLVLSLRLRRSAAQLVKLRAGNSLSGQALHLLLMWRRALPASPHQSNANHLAQCLAKSGRPDLARELLIRQTAISSQTSGDF